MPTVSRPHRVPLVVFSQVRPGHRGGRPLPRLQAGAAAHPIAPAPAVCGDRLVVFRGLGAAGEPADEVDGFAADDWTMAELARWRKSSERQAMLGRGRRSKWLFCNFRDSTRPWSPRGVTDAWCHNRASVGLRKLTFHDLRHLHATAALGAGISVNAVAERLAHANAGTVIKIYGHAIPAHDPRIADVMGGIFEA